MSKKTLKIKISKEELLKMRKPRLILKASKVVRDKTKYNRKAKHKKKEL